MKIKLTIILVNKKVLNTCECNLLSKTRYCNSGICSAFGVLFLFYDHKLVMLMFDCKGDGSGLLVQTSKGASFWHSTFEVIIYFKIALSKQICYTLIFISCSNHNPLHQHLMQTDKYVIQKRKRRKTKADKRKDHHSRFTRGLGIERTR